MVVNERFHNGKNLEEGQIFEKVREGLNPIQENLVEKKITIDEAKNELKKINEWVQGTEIEQEAKKEIGKAFDQLAKNLEKNIDENNLQVEFNEVVNMLEGLIQKDLASLKRALKQTNFQYNLQRSIEVQQGIDMASNNLTLTIHDAAQDKNPIARKLGERMENLMA